MTNRQIEANRKRAGLSKGKMSLAGRNKVRHNAISHGLTAKTLWIPGEQQPEYDRIVDQLVFEYRPVTLQEEMLVKQIAENYWRLDRAQRAEHNLLAGSVEQDIMDSSRDPQDPYDRDALIRDAFADNAKMLDNIRRYMTSAERAWHKCIDQLRRVQQDRRKRQAEECSASIQESLEELRRLAEDDSYEPDCSEYMDNDLRAPGIVSQKPENDLKDQPDPKPVSGPDAAENTNNEEENQPEAA